MFTSLKFFDVNAEEEAGKKSDRSFISVRGIAVFDKAKFCRIFWRYNYTRLSSKNFEKYRTVGIVA